MHRRVGRNDFIFLGAVLTACTLVLILFRLGAKSANTVFITVDGKEYAVCSLWEEQTIEIKSEQGEVTNIVQIKGGQAKMIDADCPDGLCMQQKAISFDKENIVCLPNKVVVAVRGEKKSELDAISQ